MEIIHRRAHIIDMNTVLIAKHIKTSNAVIAAFCRRHHIRRLSLFGSVLRDDFGPESDVDVLVAFEPGQTPGFAFAALQDELSEIIGRRVDLNTSACLSRHFRVEVLAEAEILYDTA